MKNSISQLLVLISMILLTASCQKGPFVTLNTPRSFTFTRDGGTQSITFTSNRDWNVSSSESWIQVSPSSGSATDGEITVMIICSANTTYDPRSAVVTIKVEELSEAISISQETGLGLIVSPKTFDLTNAEQTIEIEVNKNVQYSVAIDNESSTWIKQGGTKALSTDMVTFTIAANSSYDNREGKIVFKQMDGNLSETVVVRQSQANGLFISTPVYNLSNEAQTLSVEVKANVEFEVTPHADWITYVETKALSTSSVFFIVSENASVFSREGKVEITQKNGALKQVVTIKQEGQTAVSYIELNTTDITLEVGETITFAATVKPDNAYDKSIMWASSDESVVTVDINGKVTAISKGISTITATANDGSGVYASCIVTVYRFDIPDAVDLNLPSGVKWASFNIGASEPEEYGLYYAWGETETKREYNWSTYKWCSGSEESLTKYNYQKRYGIVDNKSVLEAEDDVACVKLGGNWRMPTHDEWTELLENCTWVWTTQNGISGRLVTSKNNNKSIFLPAAGSRSDTGLIGAGSYGNYWSSSRRSDVPSCAWSVFFNTSDLLNCNYYTRRFGLSVRPVTE